MTWSRRFGILVGYIVTNFAVGVGLYVGLWFAIKFLGAPMCIGINP